MKQSKTTINLLAAGAIAVIVVGWYFGINKPLTTKKSTLNTSLVTAQATLASDQLKLTELLKDKRHKGALSSQLAKLNQALPATTDLGGFLNVLDQTLNSLRMPLIGFAPAAPTAGGVTSSTSSVKSIGFSLQTEGGYSYVVSFLSQLDSLPRLVDISTVSIAPESGTSLNGFPANSGMLLSVTVSGQVYQRT